MLFLVIVKMLLIQKTNWLTARPLDVDNELELFVIRYSIMPVICRTDLARPTAPNM